MMTVKDKLKEMLTSRGMFDTQADNVLQEAIPNIEALTPDYKISWDDSAAAYPAPLYAVMWLPLRDAALKWIDANLPQAWFRPMFV